MQYIDAFNHFFPKGLWDRMQSLEGAGQAIGKRMQGVPCIYDLDIRFQVMDAFDIADHFARHAAAGGHGRAGPASGICQAANDGQAELVASYPDRFIGFLAALPMNAPEAATREAERAFTELAPTGCKSIPMSTARRSTRNAFSRSSKRPPSMANRSCCIPRAPLRCRTTPPKTNPSMKSGGPSAGLTKPAPPWRAWSSRASWTACRNSRSSRTIWAPWCRSSKAASAPAGTSSASALRTRT